MSDDSLKRRLNKEDKKIIKFLRTVDVEGHPDVTPECTITLNFDKNPYFKNSSLTKNFKISEKGIFDVRCTPVIWKNGKGNTAVLEEKSSKQSHTDMPKSFFTWFEDPTESSMTRWLI
ncbi:NAP1-related protein 2-like isoform X1 [Papaver somniferum]|uniref:NAP1-related protein 2-like isoform X1 n=1 Tax=Papaver somniferum TaxID=3469 RepID=UPI000E7059E4|nr:NAP1-related protein 2-like isoform X1 [Papaver somniferum]